MNKDNKPFWSTENTPARHVSMGDPSRRLSVLRTLLTLVLVGGAAFVPLNFLLGRVVLAFMEIGMIVLAGAILFGLFRGMSVTRAAWYLMLPLLFVLLFELHRADSPASFVWALLVPTLCHRLLGPWLGSAVGGVTMVIAGVILLQHVDIELSATTDSMTLDVLLCATALFLLSLVHERQLQRADYRLRERADLDPLTQLASRQRFREIAEQAREAARVGHRHAHRRVSMLMVDIDFFKQVNDAYGHYVGDRVLEATAQRLLENCRTQDVLGRIGGEEIAILMFDLDPDQASANAEQLRRSLADVPIHVNGEAIRVTLSLGVATFDLATTSFEAMFRETDARLYAAKNAGRNRVQATSPAHAMRPVGGGETGRVHGPMQGSDVDADTP